MEILKKRNPSIPKWFRRKMARASVSCSPLEMPMTVVRPSAIERAENDRRPSEGMESFE